MAGKISRRKLAEYAADKLLENNSSIIKELAAFLVENRRQREINLLIRDIEFSLSQKGFLIADISTARNLEDSLRNEVVDFLKKSTNAKEVYLREDVDKSLIAGMKLTTPIGSMDGSVSGKLSSIKNNYLKER